MFTNCATLRCQRRSVHSYSVSGEMPESYTPGEDLSCSFTLENSGSSTAA